MNISRSKGVTLIELMIVVAIIGIISAVAYPSYIESVKKTYREDTKEHLMLLRTAMEEYYMMNKTYIGAKTPDIYPKYIPVDSTTPLYKLVVSLTKNNRYIIMAKPQNGTMMADDRCGIFEYNSASDRKRNLSTATQSPLTSCW